MHCIDSSTLAARLHRDSELDGRQLTMTRRVFFSRVGKKRILEIIKSLSLLYRKDELVNEYLSSTLLSTALVERIALKRTREYFVVCFSFQAMLVQNISCVIIRSSRLYKSESVK